MQVVTSAKIQIYSDMEKKIAIKILNDILEYLGMSVNAFSKSLGKERAQWAYDVLNEEKPVGISKQIAELICENYPQFNKSWLLTGEGNMLKEPIRNAPPAEEEPNANYRLVPIVHIDSVGGLHSNNAMSDAPQYIEGYVPFVNAREDDRAIYESGNSMIPTIPPGSLIQIRKVESWREYFGYGNIYVIELTDGRRVTKEVAKYEPDPKNYILCKSHNPDVADEELPRSMIVSVWKVINILINKGW